jgi:YfiH family protein
VHGSDIIVVNDRIDPPPDADGLITSTKGLFLGIKSADCAPLFLIDEKAPVIGLIHCGWRSIVAGIIENAISIMTNDCKADIKRIKAFVGPTILVDDYEIGSEIVRHFYQSSILHKDAKIFLDIPKEITTRLHRTGVELSNINSFPVSTYCDNALSSYRREGKGVRGMLSVLRLAE